MYRHRSQEPEVQVHVRLLKARGDSEFLLYDTEMDCVRTYDCGDEGLLPQRMA